MIILIGIDFKTASLAIREKLFFDTKDLPRIFLQIRKWVSEAVILSTCNRMEFYFWGNTDRLQSKMTSFLEEYYQNNHLHDSKEDQQSTPIQLADHFYYVYGTKAINHLYEVASGLRSLVIGENEILGQVKKAYEIAHQHKMTQAYFNKLFQGAIAIGKKVRTQTNISRGGVSIGSTSIDLIKEIYQRNSRFSLLLIGAGKVAEEVLRALSYHADIELTICNRTETRANRIIQKYGGRWLPFEKRYHKIKDADVVISSIHSKNYILDAYSLLQSLDGKTKFIFFIDLAVPRNINPDIDELEDTALYTVDDLQDIVKKNFNSRQLNTDTAKKMINLSVEDFNLWTIKRKRYRPTKK